MRWGGDFGNMCHGCDDNLSSCIYNMPNSKAKSMLFAFTVPHKMSDLIYTTAAGGQIHSRNQS
jgi:hypothetical protein